MYILSAAVDKDQAKVALYNKEYKLSIKKDGTLADLSGLCSAVITEAGITTEDIAYAGVAVDASLGEPYSVASNLEKSIGIKCIATSLIDAKALGEAYELNDTDSLVMLRIDNTVDCGIIINKKIYTESYNQNQNIAHMVINFDGFDCNCGKCGCFEAYVSNAGLNRIAVESGIVGTVTHSQLFAMDTPEAENAKKTYIEYLAAGITNIINLFQPRHLVLDGPFTKVGDSLLNPMMDIILREQYTHSMQNKGNIRFANTEAETALLGAALLGK